MRDPRMCVPCDRCGEHLLIAEGHYSTDDRKDDAQHRARLRAAIEIGTRKLRCLRCSGRYPKNEKTIALLSGPMRPIEYRLNERKSR